jgi:carbon-monoxide dehydrogenase medium subunit
MLLPKFDFYEPLSIEEACEILAEKGRDAKALSGGTDLLVAMKRKVISPGHLVSLGRIQELKTLALGNGALKMGAGLTASELAESQEIQRMAGALGTGAGGLGSPLIRNLATLGGNLGWARPAADLPPPLMAYGAVVVLRSQSGERRVPVEEFFKGPGETVLHPEELVTAVEMERPEMPFGAGYIKLGVRKSLEISLVNVAAFVALDGNDGPIARARVALGAVAPTPIRSSSAERVLTGERPSEELFARAGEEASKDSRPIDDFRGSAQYRRAMVGVLTRRALNIAVAEAQGR